MARAPAPSAVAPAKVACAPWPSAVLLAPEAFVLAPSAVPALAFARAEKPTAVALVWPSPLAPASAKEPSAVVFALVDPIVAVGPFGSRIMTPPACAPD